ncbi:MAG TPA: hypothetical protein VJW20_11460 [Candidatus Angelobacter sp.]|nr:hypothetical protein [Candidatus Angelobacter sp.]
MKICPSPAADVVLTQYSEASFPLFSAFIAGLDASSPLRSLVSDPKELAVSVVLENRSQQAITGLRYRWGVLDQSGNRRNRICSNDSYLVDVYQPILEPASRQLISPSGSLNESLIEHARAGGGVIGGFIKSNMERLLPTTFDIDLIVFADGEIAGPDPDHFAAELKCRKPAAEFVARQIRLAADEGRDVAPVLSALWMIPSLSSHGHGKPDPLVYWTKHYARQYLGYLRRKAGDLDMREAGLRHLENRPVLPKFFRRVQ